MQNISVIGSGTMGNGIAHTLAQNNHKVFLIDISEEALKKALSTIEKNLSRQIEKGTITEEIRKQTLQNITPVNTIEAGVGNSFLVVEAATENVDLKLRIFRELDEKCDPGTILA